MRTKIKPLQRTCSSAGWLFGSMSQYRVTETVPPDIQWQIYKYGDT